MNHIEENDDKIIYILEHIQDSKKILDSDFQQWLRISENLQLFREIKANQKAWISWELTTKIDTHKEFKNFRAEINKRSTQYVYYRFAAIAGLFILSLGIGLLITDTKTHDKEYSIVATSSSSSNVELILESGERISLSNNISELHIKDEAVISIDSRQGLQYKKKKTDKRTVNYHTLKTPTGADYYVMLDDGTKVWINCESSLRYPARFIQNERIVYLDGEAYFEVSKSQDHPFIVRTGGMSINVTGTRFNVKAYTTASIVHTTLLQGEVYVNNCKLEPNQQYILDKATNQSRIDCVDPNLYVGWRSGKFAFKGQRLEDVMTDLSRWYGVKVFFVNAALKDLRFSGNLGRYDSIDKVLEIIMEMNKVKITRNNTILTISTK